MIVEAVGLFIVTHIDNLVILALFFGRGARVRGAVAKITAGQYLGFVGVLAASIVIAYGATFLPQGVVGYLGLVPLALGLLAAWQSWRGGEEEEEYEKRIASKQVSVSTVAAVTFANGGDNIGVYAPVFVTVGTGAILTYSIVFLVLVAALLAAAKFVATRRPVARALDRWDHIIYPLVLVTLGVLILVEGGAFGL